MASLKRQIEQYLSLREGTVKAADMDRALGITTPQDKSYRRVVLKRLCEKGIISQIKVHEIPIPGCYKIMKSY